MILSTQLRLLDVPLLTLLIDHQIMSDESRQIKNWLSPINFFVTQHDTFDRCQEGTGQWFLEASEFKDWVFGSGKTLLCQGRGNLYAITSQICGFGWLMGVLAGAGKTSLSYVFHAEYR
jgi:hypothetical protein